VNAFRIPAPSFWDGRWHMLPVRDGAHATAAAGIPSSLFRLVVTVEATALPDNGHHWFPESVIGSRVAHSLVTIDRLPHPINDVEF